MLYLIVALIAVLAVVSDQITKLLVVTHLSPEGTSIEVIPGVYRFTYVRNGNGMMGLFRENRWVFVVLSILVVAAIVIFFWRARPKDRLLCISLGMILGGGIGNLIDRIFQPDGKVVDFIDFCAFPEIWKYIFNVADIFVTIGVALLFLYLIMDTVREYRKEKLKRVSPSLLEGTDETEEEANGAVPTDEASDIGDDEGSNGDNR